MCLWNRKAKQISKRKRRPKKVTSLMFQKTGKPKKAASLMFQKTKRPKKATSLMFQKTKRPKKVTSLMFQKTGKPKKATSLMFQRTKTVRLYQKRKRIYCRKNTTDWKTTNLLNRLIHKNIHMKIYYYMSLK